jgi:RNA polymerase sigma factor (sigma-70 family)
MSTYYSPKDDISFIPLTRDEEKELFRRFYQDGDVEARNEIIKRHLKLTAKLSLTYAKGALSDDDAISAGNFGLIQALESKCFDPSRGYLFSSYVRFYIRGQVLEALRNSGWKGQLSDEEDGDNFAPEATVTGHHCDDTNRVRRGGYVVSLPARRCGAARGSHSRHIDADETQVDAEVSNKQLNEVRREVINRALAELPELEAKTVRAHYFRDQNHADIGRSLDMTREGVRKAFKRGMEKLKTLLAPAEGELS